LRWGCIMEAEGTAHLRLGRTEACVIRQRVDHLFSLWLRDSRRRSCPLRRDSATGPRRRCASLERSSSSDSHRFRHPVLSGRRSTSRNRARLTTPGDIANTSVRRIADGHGPCFIRWIAGSLSPDGGVDRKPSASTASPHLRHNPRSIEFRR
jgi:hypothetical protein